MPAIDRRQPSMDLRKAAKVAKKAAFRFDTGSTSSLFQRSDSEPESPRKHDSIGLAQPRPKSRRGLRLSTSSPVLHQHYQSDEEQPSPSPNEYRDSYEDPAAAPYDTASQEADSEREDEESNSDDEYEDLGFDDDFDTPLAAIQVISAATLAVAMPIVASGPAKIVSIAQLAPMQKRKTPIVQRPTRDSAVFTTVLRFKAPAPTEIRRPPSEASSYTTDNDDDNDDNDNDDDNDEEDREEENEVPKRIVPPPRNFSTPLQSVPTRSDSLSPPSHTHSGSSPSSSSASSVTGEEDSESSGDAEFHVRKSNEDDYDWRSCSEHKLTDDSDISQPQQLMGPLFSHSAEWEPILERHPTPSDPPTPTSYAAYDPFALNPPTLSTHIGSIDILPAAEGVSDEASSIAPASSVASSKLSRWKGLRSKVTPRRMGSKRWGISVQP